MATRSVQVEVMDTSTSPHVLMEDVDVLVSQEGEDGWDSVDQETTDAQGRAYFTLEDGDYLLTIRYGSAVFDVNNVNISVVDPDLEDVQEQANKFYLEGANVTPGFDVNPLFGSEDLCAVTAVLADLRGQPVKDRAILIRYVGSPIFKTGGGDFPVGIVGTSLEVRTDSGGRASFDGSGTFNLLRGMTVEVAIQGIGMTRRVTIPDAEETNLFVLLNEVTDVINVIQRHPTAVVKDSL